MVVEADESDGSFLRLPAVIAVVTNMDPEHLDHWGTAEAMVAGYDQFVGQRAVLRLRRAVHRPSRRAVDDPAPVGPAADHLRLLAAGGRARGAAGDGQAGLDVRGGGHRPRAATASRRMGPFRLPMLGQHNVQNALAAVAIAVEMDVDEQTLKSAFAGFRGVKRRFTKTGESGGIVGDRRLRPPPGRDRRRAEGGAAGRRARRDRGGAAAPLHAARTRCSPSSAPA